MRLLLSILAFLTAVPAWAQSIQVVADTPVTASLVLQVMDAEGEVRVLLPQGASAHHHQMRPSDAQSLQEADLLVWTGPELTPWLDRAAATLAGDIAQLRLLEVAGTHLRAYDDDQGHDDQGHDDHENATDPHAWLDPDNARVWLAAIAEIMGEADPQKRDTYAANAKAAADRIASLDRDLQSRLAPHADKSFVVFHDAYGYFTDHFGLKPAIPVSLGDASTPSAARLSAIRDRIAESGAVCAFPEYASDPRAIGAITEGTGIRMAGELSPEGSGSAGEDLYADLMTGIADTLTTCLSES
ncbi:zinc ABC transporter substrate-binding protein [Paracoccus subflavus]|uniref:High-affinity zinc uptake system protein ZnuA n=1 Tax=Paracoccus subflavus TaxID=2528244 RepID=A0A4Q9GB10_9RHOB|nr:zinc ABC transporter substrate-binding protein [Paracoccus subflavus]TBN44025.1 zinc ABC transporter substrate-binding protein [Paracoccus subflavus]